MIRATESGPGFAIGSVLKSSSGGLWLVLGIERLQREDVDDGWRADVVLMRPGFLPTYLVFYDGMRLDSWSVIA